MSVRFVGPSDGRLHRASKAIRKLLALGLTEEDVLRLMRRHQRSGKNVAEPPPRANTQRTDKDERLRLGQWAIRTMLALGFTESEIAVMIGVDHATIAHVLDPVEPRALAWDTMWRLKAAVQKAGAERLKLLLGRITISVLDTCNDKGQELNDATRDEMAAQAQLDLQNALVFASAPVPLMPGIHAFLARIGEPIHGLYLMKVPSEQEGTTEGRILHLRLLEHEIEHILGRFREERQRLEKHGRQNWRLPNDGSIA